MSMAHRNGSHIIVRAISCAKLMDSGSSFLLTAKIVFLFLGSYKNRAPEKEKKDSSMDMRFWAALFLV
jgi:hypothetical protein